MLWHPFRLINECKTAYLFFCCYVCVRYGNTLTVSPDTYSFALQPRIDSVSGCTNIGNATVDCDTRGSVIITIKVWISSIGLLVCALVVQCYGFNMIHSVLWTFFHFLIFWYQGLNLYPPVSILVGNLVCGGPSIDLLFTTISCTLPVGTGMWCISFANKT